ncbi:MAG TPA: MBL fold metallo-hydrolase, partial [Chthonomonadales bacterium]|nr:MBL fold metallo-hydrolase [Chthonomonadales bacterium]
MSSSSACQVGATRIHAIRLSWGNAFLLRGKEHSVLIDCGLAQDRPQLLSSLEAIGISPESISLLVLTHAHCDHAGSAAYFARAGAS